jgi:hypothetical protein
MKIKKILELIFKYIEDIFIGSGLTIIVIATFLISRIIGLYVLGIVLTILGILISITMVSPRR